MTGKCAILLAVLAIPFLILHLGLAAPPESVPATKPSSATLPADPIQSAIRDLSNAEFKVRDAADKQLRKLGWSAMTSLVIANGEKRDLEGKARLTAIIHDLAMTHTALDKETQAILEKHKTADAEEQRNLEDIGLRRGNAGFIFAQAKFLSTGDIHSTSFLGNRNPAVELAGTLEKAGAWDELQWNTITRALLDDTTGRESLTQIVWLARKQNNAGQIARALIALRKIQPQEQYKFSYDEIIMKLMIASGDVERLMAAAGERDLYGDSGRMLLLSERRDWEAMAKLPLEKDNGNLSERAAALLFLGKHAQADALMKYEEKPLGKSIVKIASSHAMLLGRMNMGMQRMIDDGQYWESIELLTNQRKYSEIPAVVENAMVAKFQQAVAIESRLIPLYAQLNDLNHVRTLVKALSSTGDKSNRGWIESSIAEAQKILGDVDIGAGERASTDRSNIHQKWPPEKTIWLDVLKSKSGDQTDTLKEVERILADKPTPQELERLIAYAPDGQIESRPAYATSLDRSYLYLWKAYLLHRADRIDLAEKSLATAIGEFKNMVDTSTPYIRQKILPRIFYREEYAAFDAPLERPADLILLAKDWKFAKPMLELFASLDYVGPSFKYLRGVCIEKLGDAKGGAELRKEADDLIGGDVPARSYLVRMLARLGEFELARQQGQVVLDIQLELNDIRFDTHRLLAQVAMDSGDYTSALDHLRLAIISKFHFSIIPSDMTIYIRLPRQVAYCEARIAIGKKDPAAALQAADPVPAIDCEDLDLTLKLITAFKDAKMNQQAEALAARNRGLLEAILKDFPNSHYHHYLVAKLDLDSGFANDKTNLHLSKALELAPKNTKYLELQKRAEKP